MFAPVITSESPRRFRPWCRRLRVTQQLRVVIQAVVQTDDRSAAAATLAQRFGATMSAEQVLATPFVSIGTVEQMAEQILRNRERYGFTYYTVHGPFADTFASD